MSFQHVINYNNPANFVVSSGAQVTGSGASCALGPMTESYSKTGGNFTGYDSNKSEIVSTTFRQKDTRPAGLRSYYAWNTQLNGNYGETSLNVTANGGAAISGGYLNLVGNGKYISVANSSLAPIYIGTLAWVYKPNYSGTPSAAQFIYTSGFATNGVRDLITIIHNNSTGNLQLGLYSDSGVLIFDSSLGVWSPTSGTEYTFCLQVDLTNGATKLFINGSQFGSTVTQTSSNRLASGWMYFGSDRTAVYTNNNFSIRGFAAYTGIVSPTNITPLNDTVYVADSATLPVFNYFYPVIDSLGVPSITSANIPHYTVNGYYWNGSVWAASSNTYATSMPSADWIANYASFPSGQLSTGVTIKIFTDNSSNQMSNSATSFTINEREYSIANPSVIETAQITTDGLISLDQVPNPPYSGSDLVKYVFNKDGVDYYWNSTAWVVSSGYAQSNTFAEINTNIAAWNLIAGTLAMKLKIYLHSNDGSTTPLITSNTVTYNNFGGLSQTIPICLVWGYTTDEAGVLLPNVSVTATLKKLVELLGSVVLSGTKTVTSNSNAYWEMELPQALKYEFKMFETGITSALYDKSKTVPALSKANLDSF